MYKWGLCFINNRGLKAKTDPNLMERSLEMTLCELPTILIGRKSSREVEHIFDIKVTHLSSIMFVEFLFFIKSKRVDFIYDLFPCIKYLKLKLSYHDALSVPHAHKKFCTSSNVSNISSCGACSPQNFLNSFESRPILGLVSCLK